MKQYYELQEPAKETIHVFGNNELEEVLLDTDAIGFVEEEECRFIQFNNHIFKYKIEFHDELTFNKEMDYVIYFNDINDESGIEPILDQLKGSGISNFIIVLQSKENNITSDEEQIILENLKNKYNDMPNKFGLFVSSDKIKFNEEYGMFCFEDEKNAYSSIDNIFCSLTKGEELSKLNEENEEDGNCCRV